MRLMNLGIWQTGYMKNGAMRYGPTKVWSEKIVQPGHELNNFFNIGGDGYGKAGKEI